MEEQRSFPARTTATANPATGCAVDPDIRRAWTLPGRHYDSPEVFALQRERVFARTWQFAGHAAQLPPGGCARPWTLLDGCLSEPLLLTRDTDARIRCLSNVCTHRGDLLLGTGCDDAPDLPGAAPACQLRGIRCRYHGRRFSLDGRFVSMPGFEEACDFPSARDDLPEIPLDRFGPFLFASLDPALSFTEQVQPIKDRLGGLPLGELTLDPGSARDFTVAANWALYCDNYLEGFHVPFVHPGLNEVLDYDHYETETYAYANLQLGVAREGEQVFDHPVGHPDRGRRVAAYYYWLFPNTMLNFYPWGLSINLVQPLGPARTRVRFVSFVWDPDKRAQNAGAGADLDKVEQEDEEVVERVQRGVRSRLYDRGRYSPTRETGVHHFHSLLTRFLTA